MSRSIDSSASALGGHRITVNSVAPGPVDTPFFHNMETPQIAEFAANLAVAGRLGIVSDIVPIVEFLALPSVHQAISIVGSAGAFRGDHRGTERMLRATAASKGRTIMGFFEPL